jgi:uncharacterized protein YgbK (DUF1537 family)
MSPDAMERTLRPAFESMRQSGAPIVHYKVCSTFDSSPTVGSIGRVIDVGLDVFKSKYVPVVVGAPSLGRYCVFGNLFARSGAESEPFRLDRHPSMSQHPITPMDEADLRLHLAKQTARSIALFHTLHVDLQRARAKAEFESLARRAQVVLVDLLTESQLSTVGALIEHSKFIVGSSGVESALTEFWRESGIIGAPATFSSPGDAGPVVAVCGSCSPVTAGQIRTAIEHGFVEVAAMGGAELVDRAVDALRRGKSVVIHTGMGAADKRVDAGAAQAIGPSLGGGLQHIIEATRVRRAIVAGGDTSGQVARALGIESLEMIGELTRGSPLCRATAPGSPADGIEITFKGGQIGPVDFFVRVQRGS